MPDWIEDAASRHGDSIFLEDARSPRRLTYRQLAQRICSWRVDLDRIGVDRGAPVALTLTDPFEYAAVLVSVLAAGRVVVPLDPRAPGRETARIRSVVSPVATIGGTGTEPAEPEALTLHSDRNRPLTEQGGGLLLCSSGTTGSRKAILLDSPQLRHVASGIASHHRLGPSDRGLCPLPLFHVNAPVVGLLSTLLAGACVVVDQRFHRRGFWELVAEREITWINAVPAILAVLAATPERARPDTRVRFVRSASAPLPVSVLTSFERQAGIPVLETYGMTEAASMITANPLDGPRKPGSAGLPVGVELQVVDAQRHAVPLGQVGRVRIRGAGVITRYFAGESEDDIDGQGWLDSKDLGFLDDDGYLYLVGRADDVINRGGENIYPREIEEVLRADPRVAEAVVVGIPDAILGARPEAYVVLADLDGADDPEGEVLVARLLEQCRSQLSAYKVPHDIHVVARLPAGPTGKVARRRVLAELAGIHA